MDYDRAVKLYLELRDANSELEKEVDRLVAANKEKMLKLGNFIQLKAEKDKLEKVPTKYGTVYWTEGCSVKTGNGEALFDFCRENNLWELVEKRASKTGVREYVNTNKKVPPGIDYVTYKQINVRKS